MRFPRVVHLDRSDFRLFDPAAAAGEWAVPGSFAFANVDAQTLSGKERIAFGSAWLGTESFGRASLVEVAEIDDAAFFATVERLARHFIEAHGAPDLGAALPAARQEADYASDLSAHKLNTLLALEREPGNLGIVERVRVVRPDRTVDHATIWQIVPDDEAES